MQATARIRQAHAADRVRIIILTTFEHDDYVVSAITAGANGFLGKGVAPSRLVAAIHEVVSGGGALSAAAAAVAMNSVAAAPKREIDAELASRFDVLTARERAVVIAAASGRSNEEIAGELFVSPFTVKTHANRAMAKVGARDRAQLVAFAHRAGIADET